MPKPTINHPQKNILSLSIPAFPARLTGEDTNSERTLMKFVCLGYIEEKKLENNPFIDMAELVDDCFTYDDHLRATGHFAGGEGLQPASTAKTLRFSGGKVVVTDGPYAETREVLGGILILEARDLDHAVELMSKHPGVKIGPFEIRPAVDLSEMMRESRARRSKR
jgi:hypothetical protein